MQPEQLMERSKLIPNAKSFQAPREHVDDPKAGVSNLKIFFLLLVGIMVVVAVTVAVITYLNERNSRKRFY